jgi:hypothetical protein
MAVAVVQSKNGPSGAQTTLELASAATAGHIIVVFLEQRGENATGGFPAPSDNLPLSEGAYTKRGQIVNASGARVAMFTKTAIGGEKKISSLAGGLGTVNGIAVFELSGAVEAPETVVTNEGAAATSATSAALTTTGVDVVLAGVGMNTGNSGTVGAWTGTGPMTNINTQSSRMFGGSYTPGTTLSAVTFTAHWETSLAWQMIAAAWKPAVAASATAADTLTLTDSGASSRVTTARTAADTLAMSTSVVSSLHLGRTVADTLSMSEAVAAHTAQARTVADTLSMTEAVSARVAQARTAGDTLTMSEATTNRTAQARTASDTLSMEATVTSVRSTLVSAADTLTMSDTASATHHAGLTAADTLAMSESLTGSTVLHVTAGDTLTISEHISAALVYGRSVSDTLTMSDAIVSSVERIVQRAVRITLDDLMAARVQADDLMAARVQLEEV